QAGITLPKSGDRRSDEILCDRRRGGEPDRSLGCRLEATHGATEAVRRVLQLLGVPDELLGCVRRQHPVRRPVEEANTERLLERREAPPRSGGVHPETRGGGAEGARAPQCKEDPDVAPLESVLQICRHGRHYCAVTCRLAMHILCERKAGSM